VCVSLSELFLSQICSIVIIACLLDRVQFSFCECFHCCMFEPVNCVFISRAKALQITLSVPSHIHTYGRTPSQTYGGLQHKGLGWCRNDSVFTTPDQEGWNQVVGRCLWKTVGWFGFGFPITEPKRTVRNLAFRPIVFFRGVGIPSLDLPHVSIVSTYCTVAHGPVTSLAFILTPIFILRQLLGLPATQCSF